MDRASIALATGVPAGVPKSYRALADHRGVPHSTLHHRSHGRPSLQSKAQKQQYLTPAEEKAVVEFILQMSALGRPIRIKYIPSIAFSATRHRSVPTRPSKPPGKNWVRALEKRHPELRARRVKAMDWDRYDIYDKTRQWFEMIRDVLQRPDVFTENVYNMDETGVMLSMLGSVKVLVGTDDMRDYRGARVKRTLVTAIECISGDGRYLNPVVIWPATTHRSNWITFPTPGWHYACSESGYTDSKISLEWLKRVFDPETKDRAGSYPRVLICDGFGTHETLEILEFCFTNIYLCRLPSHTSHKLQPCDVAVFAPLKVAYRDNVERMERAGIGMIGKQHFTSLYHPARTKAFSKRNIQAGWSKAGLIPFNPDRVLRDLQAPAAPYPSDLSQDIGALERRGSVQEVIPRTPLTPVSFEALMSLQNIIVKDARTLDETSKQNLERHLNKLTKAAGTFHAKSALQQDQISSLLKANNESKVRRATNSIVLGKAKVMSYEDLVAAREARREKEAAKEAARERKMRKGKRKIIVADRGETEAEPASSGIEAHAEQNILGEVTFQAPVACMY